MLTPLDFYKYAQFATAAYVRMGTEPLTGQRFAEVARDQNRFPLSLGRFLFDPAFAVAGHLQWQIRYYYGGDNPVTPDATGFGATLFQQGPDGEKVLAIRGTEPNEDDRVDLWQADIGAIGILGMSFPQAVSMVNLILRLRADDTDTAVPQIKIKSTLEKRGQACITV